MKTIIKTSIGRPFLRSSLILIALALGFVALGPRARAVVPAPDGGYPGGNTAEGQSVLLSLTTGTYNTAVGLFSLRSDRAGSFNTAIGAGALLANTGDQNTGNENTATGAAALLNNTTGFQNTANGAFALFSNTEGTLNTASGFLALFNNTTGQLSTAIGDGALLNNTTGVGNTALGASAGGNVTTASRVICIGLDVFGANVDNSCYIGSIYAQPVDPATAIGVQVDITGKLGTLTSSARFKQDIHSMDKASEAILALKPVTFRYKSDGRNTPCFGLIAEEVARVNPDLVVRDKDGELLSVRYDQVNAMLLNEFLKQHRAFLEEQRKVEEQGCQAQEQQATIAELKSAVARQQKEMETVVARLKEQDSKIQNVSAHVEMSKFATRRIRRGGPAPRMVLNP